MFAFDPSEISSISPDVIEHKLCVDPNHSVVIQKRRHLGVERSVAPATEVQKLLEVGFIREY